jgi:hypothetical protein
VEYQFRPLGKTCAGTGKPLAPGELVTSVIVDRGGELVRLDYSGEGWNGPPPGTIGLWTAHAPPAAVVHASKVDPEVLLRFFEQLLETGNPAHDRMLYVVALYLLQRRRFRLEGTRIDDDAQYLQLVGSRGEGPYQVRDQQLPEDEVKVLQSQLNQQLSEQFASMVQAA